LIVQNTHTHTHTHTHPAGKPRIPGGATLEYEVFFEIYPGYEDDLLEVNDEQK
jgi:hypothetical protein